MKKNILGERVVASEIFGAAACNLKCSYCLGGETNILMSDFTLKHIKDIRIGDKVIGLNNPQKKEHFKIIITEVLNIQKRKDILHKIILENDNFIEVTDNHPILSKHKRWHVINITKLNEINTKNKLMIGQEMKTIHNSIIKKIDYNDEFKFGYLKGMIDGDGTVVDTNYINSKTGKKNTNRFIKIFQALHNYEAIERVEEYLNHFKIRYSCMERDGGYRIYITRKDEIYKIINHSDEDENYKAGWLSGIFDAEGSIDGQTITIAQYYDVNKLIYDEIINHLNYFKFEHSPVKWKNKIQGVRVKGGGFEIIRFLEIFRPALKRKLRKLYNRNFQGSSEVKLIEEISKNDVYNIQTGTENYIANGFVVHNCYIPKNKKLDPIHKNIIEKLESGEFFDTLSEVYGEDLEYFSSWGTEPTLTLPHYIPHLDKFLIRFPKLKNFSFSSNFMTDSKILINLINKINDSLDDREFELGFQISLDGPPEITDCNRKKGGTKLILDNLIKFFTLANDIKIKDNLIVTLKWKPTWSIDNIRDFHKNPSKLWGFFHFFDEILHNLNTLNKNKKVKLALSAIPTLVVPGDYTKEDGIIYAKMMREVYKIQHENDSRKIFRYYNGPLDSYYHRLKRLMDFERELYSKPNQFTCSGGDSSYGIDSYGDVHLCHRTYYSKYEEYNKQVLYDNLDKREVENIKKNKVKNASEKYVANKDNEEDLARLQYIFTAYHNYTQFRINASITNIYELADSGLILKKYENYDEAYLLALLMHTGNSCPADNIMGSGNIHINSSSLYKIFGNGALDLILKEMRRVK